MNKGRVPTCSLGQRLALNQLAAGHNESQQKKGGQERQTIENKKTCWSSCFPVKIWCYQEKTGRFASAEREKRSRSRSPSPVEITTNQIADAVRSGGHASIAKNNRQHQYSTKSEGKCLRPVCGHKRPNELS